MIFVIHSVLGDSRAAEIHGSESHPWINCPFCSQPIYLREPTPGHENTNVARDGVCNDGWCVANPKMPIDDARLARGKVMLEEMAAEERSRNHALARRRILEEGAARDAAWLALRAEALAVGACVTCAGVEFRAGRRKLVRHRGPCPRA